MTAWRTFPDDLFGETICLTVEYVNVGRVDGVVATSGLSLVGPNGDIKRPIFLVGGSPTPSPPQVVPGAAGVTDVCFATDGNRGTFTARYADVSFPVRNGTWDLDVG